MCYTVQCTSAHGGGANIALGPYGNITLDRTDQNLPGVARFKQDERDCNKVRSSVNFGRKSKG